MSRLIQCFVGSLTMFAIAGVLTAADRPTKTEKEVKSLIQQLGSEQFKEREQASAELAKLGSTIMASLKEAANHSDAEIRRRARQLIDQIELPILAQQLAKERVRVKLFL